MARRFESTGGSRAGILPSVEEDHPAPPADPVVASAPERGADPALDRVTDWLLGQPDYATRFGSAIRQALDEVIDTPRTERWSLEQCNDQEKAYVGVKLEHVIKAEFDLAAGAGPGLPDYEIDSVPVDCKWSKKWGGWQIPLEAVGHLCLLLWADDDTCEMAVGLIRIRNEILVGGNRDSKRTIQSPEGRAQIRWLVERSPILPPNFLLHLDPIHRAAILDLPGGDARAAELFKRCEGLILHRHTIESVGQQVDEGRRFRGETKAALKAEGFEVHNGHWKAARLRAEELGGPVPIGSSQWVCLRSDGTSATRRLEGRTWPDDGQVAGPPTGDEQRLF